MGGWVGGGLGEFTQWIHLWALDGQAVLGGGGEEPLKIKVVDYDQEFWGYNSRVGCMVMIHKLSCLLKIVTVRGYNMI